MFSWRELESLLAERVQGERLAHVYRVVETARTLADRFGVSRTQAETAALMHDYARAMPEAELLAEGRRLGLLTDPVEEAQPLLLHGPVAAALLAERGAITDPAVLSAIRWHTTGCAHMSRLDMVIWLADYIEPGRSFPGLAELRALAEQDLEGALLKALDGTIGYVLHRGWPLHPSTVHARNWLLMR
ncbi:MAG TPA: bis(5'-nucleosyl)-tetraphosphatase (symmetrical) YqeK [Symbiobacteriaceae bacterium]|nr:bis(5'-nucleosyl)-tetraphosphatase (symmetrical) YqeK [Symbiobacteriaceae bacterium]